MRILVDPGVMPIDVMSRLQASASSEVRFITDQVDMKSSYESMDENCIVDLYPKFSSFNSSQIDYTSIETDILDVLWKVINDHQTYMLYDRTKRGFLSNSLKTANLVDYAVKVIVYLERVAPDAIVFMATPHDITRWIFARICESRNIKVRYFQETILPWRYALMEGLRRDASVVIPENGNREPVEEELISDFQRRKRGGFEQAFPIYERKRLTQNKGKIYNFLRDFLQNWKRPDLVVNKAICYKSYQSLAQMPRVGEDFLCFFLHYQPERTTLPESYGFAQQVAAVAALAAALPSGMAIYVKEHPSIFTAHCHYNERIPSWYKLLASIKGVRVMPVELDPYSLIDSSKCVVTIAGTIGGEALMRGKPVIAFGRGALSLVESPALHKYVDLHSLRNFIAQLASLTCDFSLEKYWDQIAERTFSGIQNETTFDALEEKQGTGELCFAALGAAYKELLGKSYST